MGPTDPAPAEFYVVLAAAEDVSRPVEERVALLHAAEQLMPVANPRLTFPPLAVPDALVGAAKAVTELWVALFYGAARLERERAARLLVECCREASALAKRKAA
jgi:hypothetical protein